MILSIQYGIKNLVQQEKMRVHNSLTNYFNNIFVLAFLKLLTKRTPRSHTSSFRTAEVGNFDYFQLYIVTLQQQVLFFYFRSFRHQRRFDYIYIYVPLDTFKLHYPSTDY